MLPLTHRIFSGCFVLLGHQGASLSGGIRMDGCDAHRIIADAILLSGRNSGQTLRWQTAELQPRGQLMHFWPVTPSLLKKGGADDLVG